MTYSISEGAIDVSTLAANDAKGASPELRVGGWRVDPARNELSRGAESVKLEPKVVEVLVHLARRAGQVVGREELLSAVWPGVVVGDDALTQAIIKLRKAFGDDAHRPKFIETISKRGYRLIAPVEEGGKAVATRGRQSFARRNRVVIATAIGVVLVSVGALLVFPEIAKTVSMPWPIAVNEAGLPTGGRPTIAVLPLANLSGDAKRDYFSDGMTEDIINALGRFSSVRVISRNSVEAFKGRAATPQAVKSELGARYIVKGSVREADGKLRVAVELSDAEKGVQLWSDRYDGEGKDVFGFQDRIVRNIVGALEVKVSRLEHDRAVSKPPQNLEAYDLVLRARALNLHSDRASNREARALAAKAIELAPSYAEAYVVLSGAETQRSIFGWVEDPAEGLRRAEALAQRALALEDPGAQARAHGQLGVIYATTGRHDEAQAELDRALELNPSDVLAYDARGSNLMYMGRAEEAIASLETALRFNPAGRSPGTRFGFSLAYYMQGRYRESLAVADAALARYPDLAFLHAMRAAALGQMGNTEEAGKAAAQLMRLDPYFKVELFGTRFADPRHMKHLQEGLRKAGM